MEVFGNIEALKGAIEKKYSAKIKQAEKETEKELAEIDKKLKKELELVNSHMKTITDAEVRKAQSMILSEEKLKAKSEFEGKREALIESVFEEAKKRVKKITRTKEYLDFVKNNMPKEENLSAIGDSDYYKTLFPDLKIDKNILGLKFEVEGAVYDFTLDNIINSKKDILRKEVSKILFE